MFLSILLDAAANAHFGFAAIGAGIAALAAGIGIGRIGGDEGTGTSGTCASTTP